MSDVFSTPWGNLIVPSARANISTQPAAGGSGTQGVLVVIGESDTGPRFDAEPDVSQNTYGPDDFAAFRAKYGSGPLVDAFAVAKAPSSDPDVPGTFSVLIPLKVDAGTPASAALLKAGGTTYATVGASPGRAGNLVSQQVSQLTADVEPSTGNFLLLPPQASTTVAFRATGGAAVPATLAPAELPPASVASLTGSGITASGGASRTLLSAAVGSVTLTVDSGFQAHLIISGGTWANLPSVGDLLYIPTGSPFTTVNEGSWVVTAATGSRIDARKLLDAAGAGTVLTPPTGEGPIALVATTDVQAFAPVQIATTSSATIPGQGKTLEVANSGSALFSTIAYVFQGASANPPAAPATWVSASGSPKTLLPASEYSVDVEYVNQTQSLDDHVKAGGTVALALGYAGTTASAVIAAGVMTITVAGGSGAAPAPIALANYPTIASLASYLATLTGFSAAPGSAGVLPATSLDSGTFAFASANGAMNGRIKRDAADFVAQLASLTSQVALTSAAPTTGLPAVQALTYLSGGARGGASDADFAAACAKLTELDFNHLVPCVSQDATADIAAGLTDASSTYTVAAVHQNARTAVLANSTFKVGRPCHLYLGIGGDYLPQKTQANAVSSPRVTMVFDRITDADANGTLRSMPEWANAVKAAAMQAGAGFRAIFGKGVNISGVSHPGAGYRPTIESQVEDALKAGLMPTRKRSADNGGGFEYASDQTTYLGSDPVYGSTSGMCRADIIQRQFAGRTESAMKGKNITQIPTSLARTICESILNDLRRLQWIGISDDAPQGWDNLVLKRTGPGLLVTCDVIDNAALKFIGIGILIKQPVQSA